MTDYDVISKKEILREAFAGLLADFGRYMDTKGIDDENKKEPLVMMYWNLNDIYQHIIGPRYQTRDEMIEVQGQFKFFKKYIEELETSYEQH